MLNSKRSASSLIVELPTEKSKRAKCHDILKQYSTREKIFFDPQYVKDTADGCLEVQLR